jgi:CheY-like chemotaxis protein
MFEQQHDYALCAEACDGQQAINLALQHQPDLIVLDVSMPVLDGLQAARQLKQIMPKVPIILFTQHAGSSAWAFADVPVELILPKSDGALLMQHIRTLIPV